ncbi:hypothetical protein [Stenotrophomonas sp. MMGLT7]|uniref:hypothetical protein n=1 Tax=Stenotrophomonas sp. MMGLT7 TaxID=2901227 RepID=UPI001E44587C|nr:hypothetical protein [Stenotrophomonas sp. MMGLT7]MCD7098755.1 hypothetical protein [Stenotrophomonas sp. MMGLT7]
MPPRWKTLLLGCVLGCAGAGMAWPVVAQSSKVLFPSPDYVPAPSKSAFPEPLPDRPDVPAIVPEDAPGATAADRCLAQCQAT